MLDSGVTHQDFQIWEVVVCGTCKAHDLSKVRKSPQLFVLPRLFPTVFILVCDYFEHLEHRLPSMQTTSEAS